MVRSLCANVNISRNDRIKTFLKIVIEKVLTKSSQKMPVWSKSIKKDK